MNLAHHPSGRTKQYIASLADDHLVNIVQQLVRKSQDAIAEAARQTSRPRRPQAYHTSRPHVNKFYSNINIMCAVMQPYVAEMGLRLALIPHSNYAPAMRDTLAYVAEYLGRLSNGTVLTSVDPTMAAPNDTPTAWDAARSLAEDCDWIICGPDDEDDEEYMDAWGAFMSEHC